MKIIVSLESVMTKQFIVSGSETKRLLLNNIHVDSNETEKNNIDSNSILFICREKHFLPLELAHFALEPTFFPFLGTL